MSEVERLEQCQFSQERHSLSASYGLFGRLLVSELDQALLDLLRQGDALAELQSLGIEAGELATDEQLESLAADYCLAFIGPKDHVSLVQSVTVAGRLDSGPAQTMKQFLEFVSVPKPRHAMIDHLGFQMQVMAAILSVPSASAEASNASEGDDETELKSLATSFYDQHIAWGEPVLRRASDIATTPFYKTLCKIASELISAGVTK